MTVITTKSSTSVNPRLLVRVECLLKPIQSSGADRARLKPRGIMAVAGLAGTAKTWLGKQGCGLNKSRSVEPSNRIDKVATLIRKALRTSRLGNTLT